MCRPLLHRKSSLARVSLRSQTRYSGLTAEGSSNSHKYLIRESSKLVQLEKDDTEIQPLLDEITNLRTRLLEMNVENVESINELTQDINKQIK